MEEACPSEAERSCPSGPLLRDYQCGLPIRLRPLRRPPTASLFSFARSNRAERCNLHCAVCFADPGRGKAQDPSLEKISWLLERAMAAVGPSNLQLSGGEPTLRDDLPEIVEIARLVGYSFIQVNTNGLHLA